MAYGVIDKTLEQQIADVVQSALDGHYQGELTFGPIRVLEEDGYLGRRRLTIYIVFDGDFDLLCPRWDSGALLPEHILPNLSFLGITQDTNHAFIPKSEWPWFHKELGVAF